jgi:2-polyprenyl-3-methyl-5-hydroxy-6-metoxy-1,4-benzoquinol methylase
MDKIGHNTTDELWDINEARMKRYLRKFIPFLKVYRTDVCLDMGEYNPKMKHIKSELGLQVVQVDNLDFNFESFNGLHGIADVVFALEVVEHLQNPLHFMNQCKQCLRENGSIYVTIPCNPRWLWMDGHYNEIPRKHFERWILKPLGLKTVRYKRLNFVHDWKGLFIGVRPLLRVLRGEQHWKSLLRTVLYYKYDVYEIKKVSV